MSGSVGAMASLGRGIKDDSHDRGLDGSRQERRCKVVVASTTRVKVAAVERIFRQCTVEAFQVHAHPKRRQTMSHADALKGAAAGIDAIKKQRPGADYYVAMENSVMEVLDVDVPQDVKPALAARGVSSAEQPAPCRHFDVGWVMVERALSGPAGAARLPAMRTVAPSAGVQLPSGTVSTEDVALQAGLLDLENPHSWLTAGRRSRIELLSEALAVALGQLERASRPGVFTAKAGATKVS
mmetsp:Transcript_17073/g.30818  ORF Transcript_17073/g.30818 Transcript_17073/m.30818 type:complete len:240 (+) Transcript_17073:135-854(+)